MPQNSVPSNPTFDHRDNAWERWFWAWSVIYYVSFLVPLFVFMMNTPPPRPGEILRSVVLVMIALAVQIGAVVYLPRHHPDMAARREISFIYLSALVILCVALVAIHPIFYFVLGGIFSQMFYTQPIRRSLGASLVLILLLVMVQIVDQGLGSTLRDPGTWAFIFLAGMGIVLAMWISGIIDQSDQRRRLIHELQETQAKVGRGGAPERYPQRTAAPGPGDPRHFGPGLHQHRHAPGSGRTGHACGHAGNSPSSS